MEKTAWGWWTCFGVRVSKTLHYLTVNLNPRYNAPYDHNARSSQTVRRTNVMAIARQFVLWTHRALIIIIIIILTLIPWQDGKSLTWDVTVVSTLADSYLHVTSHSAGGAAEIASVRKESKYSDLPSDYIFQPIAFENLGPLNGSGLDFLSELGRRLSALSQDPRETSFLFHSGCQSWYSATTRCSFLSHFVLTKIRTSSQRGYFVFSFLFLALGPYTPESIKINK